MRNRLIRIVYTYFDAFGHWHYASGLYNYDKNVIIGF